MGIDVAKSAVHTMGLRADDRDLIFTTAFLKVCIGVPILYGEPPWDRAAMRAKLESHMRHWQ
jgi:hypothetical protein